jgi:hypothetical protein
MAMPASQYRKLYAMQALGLVGEASSGITVP